MARADWEQKWFDFWVENEVFATRADQNLDAEKIREKIRKFYVLDMFPYPSGSGLHVGHIKGYVATDTLAKMKKLQKFAVLHPMGFDAFGLPAEQFAIKNKTNPKIATDENIKKYREQLDRAGLVYDWAREVQTTDPKFYRRTQRTFLKMYEHFFDHEAQRARPIEELKIPEGLSEAEAKEFVDSRRLVFLDFAKINRCPSCKTGLANEDLDGNRCERCGSEIEQRKMRQRMIRITDYAERLLAGLEELPEWPDHVKEMQKNWIGKSVGTIVDFPVARQEKVLFLHGFDSRPRGGWKTDLMQKCAQRGIAVLAPELPDPKNPDLAEQVDFVLKKYGDWIDENTIVVGHSLGGILMKQIVTKLGRKIKKMIGLAPAISEGGVQEHFWARLDETMKTSLEKYKSVPVDFAGLEKLVGESVAIVSSDDWAIEPSAQKNFLEKNEPWTKIVELENRGHFTAVKDGTTEIPELLAEIATGVGEGKDFFGKKPENVEKISVFTTRVDTIFGVAGVMLAPEHEKIEALVSSEQATAVKNYVDIAKNKTPLQRQAGEKEKTGEKLGARVVNPLSGEPIELRVADYVLPGYGTGAVMSVPAHDERDWDFAEKFGLEKKQVVRPIFREKNGPGARRETEQEIVERTVVSAIVQHRADPEKFLVMEWKNAMAGVKTLPMGGVENGESLARAISREIFEETGFVDFEIVEKMPREAESFFRAAHKNEPRRALEHCFVVRLKSGEQNEIAAAELAKHEPVWVEKSKFLKTLSTVCQEFLVGKFLKNSAETAVGTLVNSGGFSEKSSENAIVEIQNFLEKTGQGRRETSYKLQDWVFSRQRYRGEPIPMLHTEQGVEPDWNLPLELPEVEFFEPTGTEEGPLAALDDWMKVELPDGRVARRESNTMPQRAGSSWYWLRYLDPENEQELLSEEKAKFWGAVDVYVGGMEHATRHLIYGRFWHKFLEDLGIVDWSEPFKKLIGVGMVLGPDGQKMSKRRGNVINPDEVIAEVGADALRIYEMFMGPFGDEIAWNPQGVTGVKRFLEKVEKVAKKVRAGVADDGKVLKVLQQAIAKVTDDVENFRFNTAISQLMILVNAWGEAVEISADSFGKFLVILAPFAPFLAEELRAGLGHENSIFVHGERPEVDARWLVEDELTLVVQVNGKKKGEIVVAAGAGEEEVLAAAEAEFAKFLEGGIVKKIFVPGKIVNFVVRG